jgi:hypothetical protein
LLVQGQSHVLYATSLVFPNVLVMPQTDAAALLAHVYEVAGRRLGTVRQATATPVVKANCAVATHVSQVAV